MRSVACDDPDPSWIVVSGLSSPYSASAVGSGATIDLVCSVASRLTSPSTVREIGAALCRECHVPLAVGLGELQDALGRGDRERVDLVALDFEDGLVTQVEGRLVERRVDEAGDQKDTLLVAELGVEVGRRGRLASDLETVLRARRP